MKFARKSLSGLVLAGLLATASTGAVAQGTDAAPAALNPGASAPAAQNARPQHHGEHRMGRHDPARMQAEMKTRLKITSAQEGAWTTFTMAMQPPARRTGGEQSMAAQRAELDQRTTPERIDKMRTMRTQRMTEMHAEMDKRGEAIKAFYAALNPEQQKTFDAEHRKMGGHHGMHHQG